MAIIDILTHYDAKKKAAHAAKTVKHGVSVGMNVVICVICGMTGPEPDLIVRVRVWKVM